MFQKCFKICVCYFSGSLLQFEKSIILLILLIIMKYTFKKNVLHLVIPLITQAKPAVLWRIRQVFAVDISENNVIRHGERKFVRRGWAWMVYGSFHKSLKTLLNWPEILTLSCELLKLGCDWLSRVANYRGNY